MRLQLKFGRYTSLIAAFAGGIFSLAALASQLDFNWSLLLNFLTSISAAILAVISAYLSSRLYHNYREKTRRRVFISYSHQDRDFALKLAKDLTAIGVRPIIDRLELKVGDDIQTALDRMIEECNDVIIVASPHSKDSTWTNKEALQALKRDKRVLPVVLDITAIPEDLSGIYYADFSKDYDFGFQELAKSLGNKAEQDAAANS